jgi:GTPase
MEKNEQNNLNENLKDLNINDTNTNTINNKNKTENNNINNSNKEITIENKKENINTNINNQNLIDININTKSIQNENEKERENFNNNNNNSEYESTLEELKEQQKGIKEVRIAVIGNVDSGKSTLVGVLTKCVLDDGRGAARQLVFNYDHEKQNGRTSSIAHEIMGFKSTGGQIEPHKTNDKKNNAWSKIIKDSEKIISIIDLCGHEKYLKTTIFGLTGLVPDYAMIIIGANMGVQRMTKEHLGIALALKIPIFIVITKIDIAPSDIYKQTLEYITKVLKSTGTQKLPVVIRDSDDLKVYSESILFDRVCPIFCVSSVSGEGIEKLRTFISLLMSRSAHLQNLKLPQNTNSNINTNPNNNVNNNTNLPNTINPNRVEFLMDCVFTVKGIGLVISGTLVSGKVTIGMNLMLGPDTKGEFKQVTIKSIHYKRTPCNEISAGNSCCFHIKSKHEIKQSDIRKGMVLLDKETNYKTFWEFEAEVMILHHATTIKPNYQAVVHCGVIRQTAQVVSITCDLLRTGDRGLVRFRFIKSPEFLHVGSTILFREGRTRGIGHVKNLIYPEKK